MTCIVEALQARSLLGHVRRLRVALLPALIIVACAEGEALEPDGEGDSGGRQGSGGVSSTTGGSKTSGGVSAGGKATGGASSSGGKSATGGVSATGGKSVTAGTGGTAGSTLTGGPSCGPLGDGGASGADGGASSGSGGLGGTSDPGDAGGATSMGGAADTGGVDSAGAPSNGAGFAGAGGASGAGQTQAFCDDFEDGDAGGWAPASCDWGVVFDETFSLEGGPGTCQASAGMGVWVDQIIEARVKVTSFGGTGNSYRVGLIARFTSGNYYALGLAGNGAVRLLRATSTLSGSGSCGDYSAGVTAGTWYTLRLEVTGPANGVHLRSFIDGKLAQDCTTSNSTAVSGSAGVFTYGSNTSALFDDVRVWTP